MGNLCAVRWRPLFCRAPFIRAIPCDGSSTQARGGLLERRPSGWPSVSPRRGAPSHNRRCGPYGPPRHRRDPLCPSSDAVVYSRSSSNQFFKWAERQGSGDPTLCGGYPAPPCWHFFLLLLCKFQSKAAINPTAVEIAAVFRRRID